MGPAHVNFLLFDLHIAAAVDVEIKLKQKLVKCI